MVLKKVFYSKSANWVRAVTQVLRFFEKFSNRTETDAETTSTVSVEKTQVKLIFLFRFFMYNT